MAGLIYRTYEILCTRIMDMRILFLYIFLGLILCNTGFARSTGCTEGDCNNGYGTWTYTDKTTYVGEWSNGNMHGQGTFTLANGTVKKGIWKNGELVELN